MHVDKKIKWDIRIGDLARFRHPSTSRQDPDRDEIFFGIVIQIEFPKGLGEPIYCMMCYDGVIRSFLTYDQM